MAGKKSELGPTGVNVGDQMRRLRDDKNLGYAELSRQLSEIGREIPPLGLRRIEAGDRRVDADDLVAIALALDVSPITLLMPNAETGSEMVSVTGSADPVAAEDLWHWLRADAKLGKSPARFGDRIRDWVSWLQWAGRAAPPWSNKELLAHIKSLTTDTKDGHDQ
ncbi:helix-turn-helix domain-containing protein [Mycobacterium sp. SVM_VP21]|nr:helix-turn-helix domain-containing protein [Mycobacterium sp. SVM_VP21]